MIKILKGSTAKFAAAAEKIVAEGKDLYAWIFDEAPVGFVTFETDKIYGDEYVRASVWTERVFDKKTGKMRAVRRASIDLMPERSPLWKLVAG